MATTPNVGAAESSAPNATVTATQPAQSTGTFTATPVVTAAPVPGSPVAVAARPVAAGTVGADRKKEVAAEQSKLAELKHEAAGKDHFEQQEIFAKAFEEKEGEDSFRRAARIEREREALMSAGDPTRDPVAKQKAMDLNTVAPGAVADAQKIKNVGADSVKK